MDEDLILQEDLPGVEEEGKSSMELPKEINIDEQAEETSQSSEQSSMEPFKVFTTKEEFEDAIELEARRRGETKTETEIKREAKKLYEGQFNEETGKWEGEAPKDWNDYYNKIAESIIPEVIDQIQNLTTKEQQEIDEINKEFDQEYHTLARQKKVPPLSTEAGQEINRQISAFAAENEIPSITRAYELISKIPKEQGGLMDYKPMRAQKQRAGLVGSSKGSPSKQNNLDRTYDKMHNTPTDDLIEERMNQ